MNLTSPGLLALSTALQTPPTLQLNFYPFGVILRRQLDDGSVTEYPVDPAQIAEALAARTTLSTGLLSPDTLYVALAGLRKLVVGYRPPQKTALFLDGSDEPLRVPLPGLVLLRGTTGGETPRYALFAVKERPTTLTAALFQPPLPNVYDSNGVCWGSVPRASAEALAGSDLSEDWTLLLGSVFTSHSVHNKSKSQPSDIRLKLAELDKRRARMYPKRDLMPTRQDLGSVITNILDKAGL